jgi:hypothetical protein
MKLFRVVFLVILVAAAAAPAFALCQFCKTPVGHCSSLGHPMFISCAQVTENECFDFEDAECGAAVAPLSSEYTVVSVEIRTPAKIERVAAPQPIVAQNQKPTLPRT